MRYKTKLYGALNGFDVYRYRLYVKEKCSKYRYLHLYICHVAGQTSCSTQNAYYKKQREMNCFLCLLAHSRVAQFCLGIIPLLYAKLIFLCRYNVIALNVK